MLDVVGDLDEFTLTSKADRAPAVEARSLPGRFVQTMSVRPHPRRPMKSIRRVIAEIEHRKASLTVRLPGRTQADQTGVSPASGTAIPDCPRCGAGWIRLRYSIPKTQTPEDFMDFLRQLDLHVRNSPEGEIWVCQKSLDRFGRP